MSSDDGFPDDPFGDDMFAEEMNDEVEEDAEFPEEGDVWKAAATNTMKPGVRRASSSGESSSGGTGSVVEDDGEDDETFEDDDFEEMEELWEEVEDDDYDDEMVEDEDCEDEMGEEEGDGHSQPQSQSSLRGFVDRPAQMGRQNSSLDSLEEEDSQFAGSSQDPSRSNALKDSSHMLSPSQHSQDASMEESNSVEFDLGSFSGRGAEDASDIEEPEDMHQACLDMIAVVHPTSDPVDMIRRCDEKTLYLNLKQQYEHLIRKNPELAIDLHQQDDSEAGELWNSVGDMGENKGENFYDQGPLESTDAWGSIKGEAVGNDDVNFDAANQLPVSFEEVIRVAAQISEDEGDSKDIDDIDDSQKIEKWLERNADDPDDFEYGCRRLIQIMYDADDEEHDPDTMLRRTTARDLYRYLKQEYWYMIHTGQLEENALHRVSMLTDDGEEDGQESRKQKPSDASMISSNHSAASEKLDAVLVARKGSQNLPVDGKRPPHVESTEATDDQEDELRLELERVKEEELQVAAEESILRDSLEKERLAAASVENVEEPSSHTESVTGLERVAAEDLEGEEESTCVGDDLSQAGAGLGEDDPLANREIQEDHFEMRNESSALDGDVSSEDEKNDRDSSGVVSDSIEGMTQEERYATYTREYNNMLDRQDNGEDIDEVRLYFLELAVRQRLDEEMTDSELLELSRFDEQEAANLTNEATSSVGQSAEEVNNSQTSQPEAASNSLVPPAIDPQTVELEGATRAFPNPSDSPDDVTSRSTDEASVQLHMKDDEAAGPDQAELEWRKKKLEKNLTALIERAEDEELEDFITPEAVVALKIACAKVAFTKKFYDAKRKEHIYFPSVAKCVFDYSLIDAAEAFYKDGKEEFPFEYANALCAVAASHLNDDVDEVDEGDECIQDMAVNVCLGDQKSGESVELEMRRSMIEEELATLILDAEEQELEESIDADVKVALLKGAMDAAHIKKVFDMKKDEFVYFPSVAKAVYNFTLVEAAEAYLTNGDDEMSLEYSNALCTIAASYLRGNVDEVDPEDVYVKTTAVYVDLGDGVERNLPEPDEGSIALSIGDLLEPTDEMDGSNTLNGSVGATFGSMGGAMGTDSFLKGPFDVAFQEDTVASDAIDAPVDVNAPFDPMERFGKGFSDFDGDAAFLAVVTPSDGDSSQVQDSEKSTVDRDESSAVEVLPSQEDACDRFANLDELSEQEKRKRMIESELLSIIRDAEENDLDGSFPESAIDTLQSSAARIAFVKKYFDVTADEFVYFPSVAKTIMNYTLFEEVDKNGEHQIPAETIAAIRATAARFVEQNDVDETDDYVYNMSVDVDIGTDSGDEGDDLNDSRNLSCDELPTGKKDKDETSTQSADQAVSSTVEPDICSEKSRLQRRAKDELHSIMTQAEEQELGDVFDHDAVQALVSALKICYNKKFYDVLKDEVIYFPSVVRTIVDYSLTEEAQKLYFAGEEEDFPTLYVSSLREIAISQMADDDLDYDYMGNLALPVDDSAPNTNSSGEVTPPEDSERDMAPEGLERDVSVTNPNQLKASPVAAYHTSNQEAGDRKEDSKQGHAPIQTPADVISTESTNVWLTEPGPDERDGVGSDAIDPAGSSSDFFLSDPAIDKQAAVTNLNDDEDEKSESLGSQRLPLGDNMDCLESQFAEETKETNTAGPTIQRMEVIVAEDERALFSVPSELTSTNIEDCEAEDARLKEMAQIIEFKRRVDKQKISDEAKALETMKKESRQELDEETNRLEEEFRIANSRLDEEAALLREKWLSDDRKIEEFLQELQSTSTSELERISSELEFLIAKRQLEPDHIEKEDEKERDEDGADHARKLESLRSQIHSAKDKLEEARKKAEEDISALELEEKKGGFFGFGGRGKKSDIEKEKQKHAKLMEFKIRELEMEREIQELEEQQSYLEQQWQKDEAYRLERRAQLSKGSLDFQKNLADHEHRLEQERKTIEEKLEQGQAKYKKYRLQLEETKKDDEGWLEAEKAKLHDKRKSDLQHLEQVSAHQMERERHAEERFRKIAIVLKEKWVKEEAAFAVEVQAFEKSFGEFTTEETLDGSGSFEITKEISLVDHIPKDLQKEEHTPVHFDPTPNEVPLRNSVSLRDDDDSEPSSSKENVDISIAGIKDAHGKNANITSRSDGEGELSENVPDHLVVLNQPKRHCDFFQSIDSISELFEKPTNELFSEKPLLTAALMAKEKMQMNASLSALDDMPRQSTEQSSDLHKSVPDHLVLLHQPRSIEMADGNSMRSLDVFDDNSNSIQPEKPLLAAALKAKNDQLAKSFSALEGLPALTHDTSDISKSAPSHLYLVNQPKELSKSDDLDSIEEQDLFDPPKFEDPDAIPNKPLLTAALKAKKEQLSKSFSVGDAAFFADEKESILGTFSKSLPAHKMLADLPTGFDESFERIVTLSPGSPTQKFASEDIVDKASSPLKEVQGDSTPRRTKQTTGLASKLALEAIAFKENSMNDSTAASKENDAVTRDCLEQSTGKVDDCREMAAAPDLQTVDDSVDRLSWWKANGKLLVTAQMDPAKEDEKKSLTQSLLSHNRSIASTKSEAAAEIPKEHDMPRSPARDSISEKRREAAQARQKAIAIRQQGPSPLVTTPNDAEGEEPAKAANFDQARQLLQDRVDTANEPLQLSPGGNARAQEWAMAAADESEDEGNFVTSAVVDDSSRLDWWRKNGKKLVEEVRFLPLPENEKAEAVIAHSGDADEVSTTKKPEQVTDEPATSNQDVVGMSRREILAEKRRQILEARKALQISETNDKVDVSSETDPNTTEKIRMREVEAQRLAERTKQARESRLAREAKLTENAKAVASEGALKASPPTESASVPRSATVARAPSLILQPMVREADRLSGFIRRYENKLETICKSMLTMVAEDTGSEEAAKAANETPLPEMLEFITQQDWYQTYSATSSSSPRSLGPPTLMFSRSESKRTVMAEMNNEQGVASADAMYCVTAVGKAFLQMDGPAQADMARFLVHLDSSSGGKNRETLMRNWKEIAQLSGDAQSQRICDKLDDLISFGLAAHMIK